MSIALFAFGAAGLLLALALYHGFVLWVLWGWFIVPLGLPPIGIAWCIGISVIAQTLTATPPPAPADKSDAHMATIIMKPAFALLIGWIAKQFM